MNKLPSYAHRSVSVREQRQQTLPHLRRSASTYGGERTDGPVEIGSKGSIFSLVNRDITAGSSDSATASGSKKASNYIWYNRLWLVRRKTGTGRQHKAEAGLETAAVDSKQEIKTPKWKRLLKKLKGGSKGDRSIEGHEKTRTIPYRDNTSRDASTSPSSAHQDNTSRGMSNSPSSPPQTSNAPSSLIWERRNFVQISPLDFSHLYTARIKKELARLPWHN